MSIYPVQAATAQANASTNAGSGTTGTSGTTSTATDYTSMFMQLLATELQSQDPTQTMDPTTMVTQMVQINQLNDVAGIYSILQGGSSSNTAAQPVAAHSSQSAASVPGGN